MKGGVTLASKSEGSQFLLNIKPKYRKTVSPILKLLKENREASDFVCQAILEKVSRDGITSTIESQVESILEGKTIPSPISSNKEVNRENFDEVKIEVNGRRIEGEISDRVKPSTPENQKTNLAPETVDSHEIQTSTATTEQQTQKAVADKNSIGNRFFDEDE